MACWCLLHDLAYLPRARDVSLPVRPLSPEVCVTFIVLSRGRFGVSEARQTVAAKVASGLHLWSG